MAPMTNSPVKHLHSLPTLLNRPPQAWADLRGDVLHPGIYGIALFHQTPDGVIVAVDVSGLPSAQGACSGRFFAFHIHEGSACRGSATDPVFRRRQPLQPDRLPPSLPRRRPAPAARLRR